MIENIELEIQRIDAISRERALSNAESILLETLIKRFDNRKAKQAPPKLALQRAAAGLTKSGRPRGAGGRQPAPDWPADMVEALREAWNAEENAADIAKRLGISRSAVYGRARMDPGCNPRSTGRRRYGDDSERPVSRYPNDPTGLRRFNGVSGHRKARKLPENHPAAVEGRSVFQNRLVSASETEKPLKSGHNSRKIGKIVTKGPWKGFPLFTLTLEERRTCPRSCQQWLSCFGGNMQWAHRIVHDKALMPALDAQLEALQARHSGGFAVRLHVLGDFYSVDYANFWRDMLDKYPALHVFGFTARLPGDPIGRRLFDLAIKRFDRFAMRFSGAGMPTLSSEVVDHLEDATGILCPAQTDADRSCASCGLCWATDKTITFTRH